MLGHRTLDVEDYVGILKRRGWMIAIPVILLPILMLGISFLVAPEYLSKTTVIIDEQKVPDSYVKSVISEDLNNRLASMREQILSRSRLQPIIERYNLYGTSHLSMDERLDRTGKSIGIKPITSEIEHVSGLPGFSISFEYGDARTAQLVCGEITSLFLGENLRSREAAAEGTTDFLKGQLADAKKNLDEQDAKLAEFQRANVGRLPNEESPNFSMFQSLNAQLEAVNQDIARIEQGRSYGEAMLAQMAAPTALAGGGAAVTAGSAAGIGTAAQQAEMQALEAQRADLLSHYTADYPDVLAVKRKIAELRKEMAEAPAVPAGPAVAGQPAVARNESTAVQQLRAQIHATDMQLQDKRKEQADIQANIRMYQERIQASPLIEAQYKALTRDHQTAQAFYDDLLTKMNQSKMATDLEKRQQGEQFRIEDEPNLPTEPTSPKRPVFVMGGLAGGLALGVMLVGLLEYKDTSLRSERDVWAFTNLPTLATIDYLDEIKPKAGRWALAKWKGKPNKTEPSLDGMADVRG